VPGNLKKGGVFINIYPRFLYLHGIKLVIKQILPNLEIYSAGRLEVAELFAYGSCTYFSTGFSNYSSAYLVGSS
jgi:hypothetical protein